MTEEVIQRRVESLGKQRQGRTLNHLMRLLSTRNPAGLKVCALIDKREGRDEAFRPDYVGFNLPGVFVVGYGLDYRQLYRNLPYVGTLKPEIFSRP
ncbi:MAG: hypothetical protein HYU64_02675 [Armatimonadetes bacterium]|nr:hypothetical protein [Armatimonadota bacterium]